MQYPCHDGVILGDRSRGVRPVAAPILARGFIRVAYPGSRATAVGFERKSQMLSEAQAPLIIQAAKKNGGTISQIAKADKILHFHAIFPAVRLQKRNDARKGQRVR